MPSQLTLGAHRATLQRAQPSVRALQCGGRARRQAAPERRVHAGAAAAASSADGLPAASGGVGAFLDAAWKFVRPHTIRGTLLGTTALVTKALLENSHLVDWALLPRALMGLVALLCGNGYIVGINQIYDVDIDTLNKPFLPIAAGLMTPATGRLLCGAFAAVGLALTALNFDRLITGLYSFGLFLGTIYSVPPLRLKRFAVPAFLIIACVRGVLLNFGVYHATRSALGLPFAWSPVVAFITGFVTLFATAIAITKDLPDIEGDRKYGIETLATRMGVRKIAFLGSAILGTNYAVAIGLACAYSHLFNAPVMIAAHAALAAVLLWRTLTLDRAGYSPPAIQEFYRWVWNLFYSEYLLLPFL